jgi:hypothetical protein
MKVSMNVADMPALMDCGRSVMAETFLAAEQKKWLHGLNTK